MDLHHRRCGASRPRPSGLRIAWGARSAGDRLRAGADNLVTSTLDLKCEGRLCGVRFVFSRVHAMRGTHIEGARSDNQRDRKITDNVVELPIEARAGLPIAGPSAANTSRAMAATLQKAVMTLIVVLSELLFASV